MTARPRSSGDRDAAAAAALQALRDGTPPPPERSIRHRDPKPPNIFDAMRESLRAGVSVVVNPDLFPTPPELAARVVALADVAGQRVLEPSAGTGMLAHAARTLGASKVVCVESDVELCRRLLGRGYDVRCFDFLSLRWLGERFDRVVMNPPFSLQRDIAHVTHAWSFVAPGGRLVAIVSAGAAFRSNGKANAFRALVAAHGTMEHMPEDSFVASGTRVRTALVVLDKPMERP